MIQTVDNYQKIERDTNRYYFRFDKPKKYEKDVISEKLEINLNDYKTKSLSLDNIFFSFFKDEEKTNSKNEDDLIISIKKSKNEKDEDIYIAQTGNYVGKFV